MFWWKWKAETEDGIRWFYTRFPEEMNVQQVLAYAAATFPNLRPLSAEPTDEPPYMRKK